jgi:hypothetical protein
MFSFLTPNCVERGRSMRAVAILACLASSTLVGSPAIARESDAQIKQKIIHESIDNYSGNCPCPYNTDRAGRSCGRRSAYSRPGGYSPKCFASDVSEDEVRAYRASH